MTVRLGQNRKQMNWGVKPVQFVYMPSPTARGAYKKDLTVNLKSSFFLNIHSTGISLIRMKNFLFALALTTVFFTSFAIARPGLSLKDIIGEFIKN